MVWFGAGPVASAIEGNDAACTNDIAFVGAAPAPLLGEDADGVVDFLVGKAAKDAISSNDSFITAEWADGEDRIPAQPHHVGALVNGLLEGVVLAHIPVFIVANAEEGVAAGDLFGVQTIAIGTVGDIVAVLFHPVGQRIFPEEKLARANRERVLENLRVLRVRSIKADGHIHRVRAARVGIERVVIRPFVVRLPGIVAALKKEISRPLIAHDEDDIALPVGFVALLRYGGEPPEINTTWPVRRDLYCGGRFPLALAQAIFTGGWLGLRLAL